MGSLVKAFVDINMTMLKDAPEEIDFFKEIIIDDHTLWGLHFENVQRIKPFEFKGKQGVGILSDEHKNLIEIA